MSNNGRLYMAVHVYDESEEYECDEWCTVESAPEPEGWREYALANWGTEPREGEVWPNGHKPFFYPKTNVPYRARSTAQWRVDVINRWGGNAIVLECTPQWESIETANKRRADARVQKRIDRKRAELAALEAQVS